MDLWDSILARIESKVNRHSFNTWFRPTRLLFETANTLAIQVPNAHFRDWLTKHYTGVIHESLDELDRRGVQVIFEAAQTASEQEGPSATEATSSTVPDKRELPALNAKYTFDSFVVGTSNQFAHAAARAVAESPARAYNPLFIYGGVGLGKTHLLHAIGRHILEEVLPV